MNIPQMYKEFERSSNKSRKLSRQECKEKHRAFTSYSKKIDRWAAAAKQMGLNKQEAEIYIRDRVGIDENVYGFSFITLILSSIISWLIRKFLEKYFT